MHAIKVDCSMSRDAVANDSDLKNEKNVGGNFEQVFVIKLKNQFKIKTEPHIQCRAYRGANGTSNSNTIEIRIHLSSHIKAKEKQVSARVCVCEITENMGYKNGYIGLNVCH